MNKIHSRLYVKIIIFLFLFFGLLAVVYSLKRPAETSSSRLWIKLQDNTVLYKTNDFIRGFLVIDSNNQPVNDFNIIFTYDSTKLQLITFENLEQNFQAVKKSEKGKVVLTWTKKLSISEPLILKETPLVIFNFKALKPGNSYLGLQFFSKKINGETIFIGRSITVSKNQTAIIPGTNLKLKLQSIEKPGLNCRDCLTIVALKIEDNGKTKDLIYKSGGIAGVMFNQIDAFSYSFKPDFIGENEISLIYYKI